MRAEIRARQAEDGKKAMAEYEASAAATRAKTEKLKALRLAKEAAERPRPSRPRRPKPRPSLASKKKKGSSRGQAFRLAEDQSNSGRST
jgi:hypothetical protein